MEPVLLRRLARLLPGAALLLLLLGPSCATYDASYPRVASSAFQGHAATPLGRFFAPPPSAGPGESGVGLVRQARTAFEARIALADLAEHALDLQYYIWDADVTGRLLGERLVAAAERGVRVRVLLDDLGVRGRDSPLARLSGHPNIEVRAFNPFRYRDRRWADFLSEPSRVNRRGHNKAMIADNAAAIIGGRNIADHYFGAHGESNYRDLDTFVVGPVVRDASRVFDAFWNSEWSVPYAAFVEDAPTAEDARAQAAAMRQKIREDPLPYPIAEDQVALRARLDEVREDLVWAPARVLYDDPSKVVDPEERGIAGELAALAADAEDEILIENAYFVPREPLVEAVCAAEERGVAVRVLTNSLVSNDVAAVHAGYKKHREDLLACDVALYELRPDSTMKEEWSILSTESRAGLHAKATVVDREHVVIGSYNLDPRSADINTELVLQVDSEEFGRRVGEWLDGGVAPENAYRVRLEDGSLVWTALQDGEEVVFTKDPESSWWQRFTAGVIGLLPIQSQL